jgi:hypothetical protein
LAAGPLGGGDIGPLVDEPPDALHEAARAVHADVRIDDVALGRAVGEHEPARDVGAVLADELVEVDGVLARLRHLLDRPMVRARRCDLERAPPSPSMRTWLGCSQPPCRDL